jgi:hypothetical protein
VEQQSPTNTLTQRQQKKIKDLLKISKVKHGWRLIKDLTATTNRAGAKGALYSTITSKTTTTNNNDYYDYCQSRDPSFSPLACR